jgi:sulfur-carrier protein adenylyltransferase/sulfurtransferase
MNNDFLNERYARQLSLKNFGGAGQQQLLKAKVLMIGAGGLGCPALQYLAAAGVGTIGIVDDDTVSLSNLQRQVLYTTDDIGFLKAEKAGEHLRRLNPEINIIVISERLIVKNALDIIAGYDFVLDGSDNFSSRYMINDACVLLNKPLVYGAISAYEGQLAIFNGAINYRDLFPVPPKEDEVPDCAHAGVLGVLPGMIGVMMAAETIKLITGIGQSLVNCLLVYNMLNNQFYQMDLMPSGNAHLNIPADRQAFERMDYMAACAPSPQPFEISSGYFDRLLVSGPVDIIDVREPGELPLIHEFDCLQVPLGKLKENIDLINSGTVITLCSTGTRSRQAAKELVAVFGTEKKVYSLHGGIQEWKHARSKQLL